MANRHLARSTVLQILFEWDFDGKTDQKDVQPIFDRTIAEFAPGIEDVSFPKSLLRGILDKKSELDQIIEKAAPEWPLDKINVVDRNVLRIGLYELLFEDRTQVPAKVAINEAVELAKTFGGDTSGKFVNGVLGAVYKEIGEPGKDEVSKKKRTNVPDVPYEEMPIERLAGAIVFARDGKKIYVALVHDIFGHWTLSKGHLEEGEITKKGVVRVIKDEIGIDVSVVKQLGENEYVASHPEKGKIRKQVSYFLAEGTYVDLDLKETGGLDSAQWFPLGDIGTLNFYDDIVPLMTKAIEIITKDA